MELNCWKSINMRKEHNSYKIGLLSIGVMVITFIFSYLGFSLYYSDITRNELGLVKTFLFFFMLFPLHSFLHMFPLWVAGVRLKPLYRKKKNNPIPTIKLIFTKPVARNYYLAAMLFPALFINVAALIGATMFPSYMHYFLLVLSFNVGLAVYDFIYIKHLLGAPKDCFIEQNQKGLDILLKQPV